MTKPSAASAGAWSAAEVLLRQGLQFVTTVILARLLSPEDFGIFAILAVMTSFAIVFLQGGLTITLIQRQDTSAEQESAIFWWNLAASVTLSLVFAAVAVPVARFFDQPVLVPLTGAACAHLVLSAAGAVHSALLTRHLRFDTLTRAGVTSSVIAGVAAIAAAVAGAGIWALAILLVVQTLVGTLMLWMLLPWRPLWHWRAATLRGLAGFGGWVGVGNVLDVLYNNAISLVVGKLFGMRELGFYSRAVTTQILPGSILTAIVGRVALPVLAGRQGDPDALRAGVRSATATAMLINVPVMVGMALLSREIVVLLFGERWLPSAPLLAILALGGILLPMHVINLQAILAGAQSAVFMRVELAKKACGLALIVLGSLWGVSGLAWSQVALSMIALAINALPTGRQLGYGMAAQLRDLWSIWLASAAMALAVFWLRQHVTASPVVVIIVCTLAGATAYAACGWLTRAVVFRDMAALVLGASKTLRLPERD